MQWEWIQGRNTAGASWQHTMDAENAQELQSCSRNREESVHLDVHVLWGRPAGARGILFLGRKSGMLPC